MFSRPSPLSEAPRDVFALIAALRARNNDLYAPALRLMPEVGMLVKALEQTEGCLLARMSGSGATCFGLYADEEKAQKVARALQTQQPAWWIEASHLPL